MDYHVPQREGKRAYRKAVGKAFQTRHLASEERNPQNRCTGIWGTLDAEAKNYPSRGTTERSIWQGFFGGMCQIGKQKGRPKDPFEAFSERTKGHPDLPAFLNAHKPGDAGIAARAKQTLLRSNCRTSLAQRRTFFVLSNGGSERGKGQEYFARWPTLRRYDSSGRTSSESKTSSDAFYL